MSHVPTHPKALCRDIFSSHDARTRPAFACRVALVAFVVMLINWSSPRGNVQSTGLGGSRVKDAIASRGYSKFGGGTVITAVAQQGSSQCVSTYKVRSPFQALRIAGSAMITYVSAPVAMRVADGHPDCAVPDLLQRQVQEVPLHVVQMSRLHILSQRR